MMRRFRGIVAATLAGLLGIVGPAANAQEEKDSAFDRIWRHATLYEDADNPTIQKFALSGRLQADGAWFDADQGRYSDAFLWRRFRFGFKADLFQDWVVHIEADIDLEEPLGDMYSRLTDAYVGWSPGDHLEIKALKQSVGFTLDGATSSKKLLTMQRNNLTNNLWSTDEYFTGIDARGAFGQRWRYRAGLYSSDGSPELSHFDASWFSLLSLGYQLAGMPESASGSIRVDYVYNDEDPDAATADFSQVLSLVTQWRYGPWGVRTDLAGGAGYAGQSDVWGLVLMPSFDFTPRIQTVLRYTYMRSAGDNGLRLTRYADEIVPGEGNEYNEIYAGVNVFFYGHKLKWQTGLEYDAMRDDANDGGEYSGWGLSTGLRISW
jgi:phosphate-selective porin OprO/OprP